MTVLSVLEWLMLSHSIITTVLLLMFVFGIFFSLIRGGRR